MSDVTRILSQIDSGDPAAAEQLLPLVYNELRKLAASRLAQEKPGQTLQATALVHEAYLRLVGPKAATIGCGSPSCNSAENVDSAPRLEPSFHSRGHFFGAVAEAMRRILIDQARHKACAKAGGDLNRLELAESQIAAPRADVNLLALDEALDKLASHDRRKAELVKLRFFAGLTLREAAQSLGISDATADADWAYAKAWLRLEMGPDVAGRAGA